MQWIAVVLVEVDVVVDVEVDVVVEEQVLHNAGHLARISSRTTVSSLSHPVGSTPHPASSK